MNRVPYFKNLGEVISEKISQQEIIQKARMGCKTTTINTSNLLISRNLYEEKFTNNSIGTPLNGVRRRDESKF